VSIERDPRRESEELARLSELVTTLRRECPWDRRQSHASLAPHLLEETYEALDAIEALASSGADADPRIVADFEEELGDVLFQVFFHSELASEEGRFTLADVSRNIHDKLVSRHPHVFGDAEAQTARDVAARWEVLKRSEKKRKGVSDSVPHSMPSLALAGKLLKKADSLALSLPDVEERLEEISHAARLLAAEAESRNAHAEDSTDEPWRPDLAAAAGKALLALTDLARRAGVDAELALRSEADLMREGLDSAG
jgi:MazG family protein